MLGKPLPREIRVADAERVEYELAKQERELYGRRKDVGVAAEILDGVLERGEEAGVHAADEGEDDFVPFAEKEAGHG